jgi:hypothetical protein
MAIRIFFLVLFVRVMDKFSKNNWGQLQRKVGKFGKISKIIIFLCTLDHN